MKKWPRQLCPKHMIHHDTEPKEGKTKWASYKARMSQTNPSRLAPALSSQSKNSEE